MAEPSCLICYGETKFPVKFELEEGNTDIVFHLSAACGLIAEQLLEQKGQEAVTILDYNRAKVVRLVQAYEGPYVAEDCGDSLESKALQVQELAFKLVDKFKENGSLGIEDMKAVFVCPKCPENNFPERCCLLELFEHIKNTNVETKTVVLGLLGLGYLGVTSLWNTIFYPGPREPLRRAPAISIVR